VATELFVPFIKVDRRIWEMLRKKYQYITLMEKFHGQSMLCIWDNIWYI